MEAIQSWVSKHKFATVGGLWAFGIGESLVACTRYPMKPSLRLIHARIQAQALTLAVLSGAAAYHYYKNRAVEQPKPQAQNVAQLVEWELLSPF